MRKPYYSHNDITLFHGNALDVLAEMEPESVHCCVTSPPYFGLRDYGVAGQIGLEDTPDEFIARLVEVFRQVRRVLRPEATCWINIADSYAGSCKGANGDGSPGKCGAKQASHLGTRVGKFRLAYTGPDVKPKDLIGIPWMLAFALRADGWWLRSDIIWQKLNPMPESVRDRPTKSHEYVFLLSKQARYFYDGDAIREPQAEGRDYQAENRPVGGRKHREVDGPNSRNGTGQYDRDWDSGDFGYKGANGRNKRSVWTISAEPNKLMHFACFPTKLVEPCILAGCPEGGIVLDPFAGVCTTGIVAIRHRRKFVGIDLKREYLDLAIENMDGRPIRLPLEVS